MDKRCVCVLAVACLLFLMQPAMAWKLFSADAPDSGLLGNSFVDLLYHDGIIWAASGTGLSLSEDMGQTWSTYTTATGLGSNDPSALYGRPGEIWVAGSHFEMYDGINYPFGDGINMSTNDGQDWELYEPDEASNFAHLVYDLDGTATSTYAACFHGGLIVLNEGETEWKHLYYTPADSNDYVADDWADLETGRYYSCAADTFHTDTTIVWAGSAAGIQKFLYLPKRDKLGGKFVYDFTGDSTGLFFATEGGVTRADTSLTLFYSFDVNNGLPFNWVNKLLLFDGILWAGPFDPSNGYGAGLYYSTDSADNWQMIATDVFTGENSGVHDFATFEDSIMYIAAGDSGIYRSADTGSTWTRFYIDSTDMDPANPLNQINSVDVIVDTIYLGTNGGFIKAAYTTDPFAITFDTLYTFEETDSTGSAVTVVRHNDGDNSLTYLAVKPLTANGTDAAIYIADSSEVVLKASFSGYPVYDIKVSDSIAWFATATGMYFNRNVGTSTTTYRDVTIDPVSLLTLDSYDFYRVDFINDKVFVGSSGGLGYRVARDNWRITIANTDPLSHDKAFLRTVANSGLYGNWVVALDMQPYTTDTTVLWAACRRVEDTLEQYNGVSFSTDFGVSWTNVLQNLQVWNFAFDANGTAYAAASEGLYYASPPWTDWTRADIIDPLRQDTIIDGTEVYSVAIVEDNVWVGTQLGLASRPVSQPDDWEITRIFAGTESNDEVFAAPVPYSPLNFSGRLTLHYHIENTTDVTVKIYDFAMNLVKVVTENKPRAGGADYYETWDGYNERGDMVATGIYYFKVAESSGNERWGRLAIIP